MNPGAYYSKPFPLIRRISIDGTRLSRSRNYTQALIEADITLAYERIMEKRKNNGEKVSLTAWVIKRIAETVADDLSIQAMRKRNKLIIFHDVDIMLAVETKIQGESFPVVHVLRKVQEKTDLQITKEILNIRKQSLNEEKMAQWNKVKYFIRLPWLLRRLIYRWMLSSPQRYKKWMGTAAVTAVGMFGKGGGWGISLPNHTLAFTLGGISLKPVLVEGEIKNHRFLGITISVDHDIIDGAPAARFVARLRKRLET